MAYNTDRNQQEIVAALRQVGAQVVNLAMVGKNVPDLLVGYRGVWTVMEIKNADAKGKLRKGQAEWWQDTEYLAGIPPCIVWSIEDALKVIGAL